MSDHPCVKMKAEKRAALFAAATREFTEHGFEQASLNRIIGEVGMSKGSFYHYFANKSELFEQIMRQTFAPLSAIAAEFNPEALSEHSFWPDLLTIMEIASDMAQNAPEIISVGRMFYRNLDGGDGLCAEMMEMAYELITRLIKHGQALGMIRQDLPLSLLIQSTLGLGVAIDRWGVEVFETLDGAEVLRLNEKMLDMFIRILAPEM